MIALPLPILTFLLCVVACVLIWRFDLGNRLARALFTGTFILIAASTLLVGLRFGYGIENFIALQRLLPLFVGPLNYLGFVALTRPTDQMRPQIIKHLGVALAVAILPQFFPIIRQGFDIAIGLSYLFYAIALFILWRKGTDILAYAPLHMAQTLRFWTLGSAVMLSIVLIFDSGIALSFAFQRSDNALQLITTGSVISMFCLILFIFAFSNRSPKVQNTKRQAPPQDNASAVLENSARMFLADSKLYLDTDLTLERLAKRLHVPARALSEAINQTQGLNVSQYVNGFRLAHATDLLKTSKLNITQVMEESGFLTRSNFYREFERAHAMSPTQYRKRALDSNLPS